MPGRMNDRNNGNDDDTTDWYTPLPTIGPLVDRLRRNAESRLAHPLSVRKSQLRSIVQLIDDNRSQLAESLRLDLGQPIQYAEMFELTGVNLAARFALDHLDAWASTSNVPTPFPTNLFAPISSEITPYPRGLVLIMSPWNFPLQLVFNPLINAISAGNVCIVKPSERSVHTSKLITELIPRYLDPELVGVVNGGADVATELLKYRYDAICYTGNATVGRIVARAAADHLTPTLLELGGKTPAIVCDDADIQSAATRIAWGKWTGNMGQFCIAPDYVLVMSHLKDAFVSTLIDVLKEFYGNDPKRSDDVGRLITIDHAERVSNLLDGTCRIVHGGKTIVKERYVEPTIVEVVDGDSTCMKDEIFGPILAIVSVPDVPSAARFVNEKFNRHGDHPLNLYVFARSKQNQRYVMDRIQSGMCCVNHVILNGANLYLPFGGVGHSGMGSYYGKHGFDFFSHRRGALVLNNFNASRADPGNWIALPPYGTKKVAAYRLLTKLTERMGLIRTAFKLAVPVLIAVLVRSKPEVVDAAREFNINTIIEWVDELVQWFQKVISSGS